MQHLLGQDCSLEVTVSKVRNTNDERVGLVVVKTTGDGFRD